MAYNKTIQFLALAFAVINFSSAGTVPESGNKYTFLGSFKHRNTGVGPKGDEFKTEYYFTSVNPTTHAVADKDCRNVFGESASLLSIETKEEEDFIIKTLSETDSTATVFWTSGQFDSRKSIWRWANGIPVAPWPYWGNGFPIQNSQMRITFYYENKFNSWWETQYATTPSRYICELPRSTIAVPCYEDNDLIIVVDSSGSIGSEYYGLALNFTAKLSSAWKQHSENRLGVKIFSSTTETVVGLTNTLDAEGLVHEVLSAHYLSGGTATHLGINAAVDEEVANNRGVKQNMVVITDGASNSAANTSAAAQRAAESGIRVFAVGITQHAVEKELLEIAGNNAKHVFFAETFEQLVTLLTPISSAICYD